jgi:hypothetical protein
VPVPPLGTTVAVPFGFPHVACVELEVAVKAVGSVSVKETVIKHPFISAMVQV